MLWERLHVVSLSDNIQADVVEAFNSTSRYLDDFFNFYTPYFEQMVSQVYPDELQFKKANSFDTKSPLLDLDLSLMNVIASSKIYDRREDFNLEIVNFPFIGGNIRHSPSCGVYISKFIFLREYVLILVN